MQTEWEQVHVSNHPLIIDHLTKLRDHSTTSGQFRDHVTRIAHHLIHEATQDLPTVAEEIETPLERTEGRVLADSIGVVPILRAGLGMVEAAQQALPEASVLHLGLSRNEETLQPITYYDNLPTPPSVARAFILDPMLATGGTASAAAQRLRSSGIRQICFIGIVGCPEGIEKLLESSPNIKIHLASIDRQLDERGYIVPGLGDAGDRMFATL